MNGLGPLPGPEIPQAPIRIPGKWAVFAVRNGIEVVWSTRDSAKGGKIALANAKRAASKHGFSDVWLVTPDGEVLR